MLRIASTLSHKGRGIATHSPRDLDTLNMAHGKPTIFRASPVSSRM
jgi:hypothetical protein